MTNWIKVCNINEINDGQMFSFNFGEKKILLSNINNKIYAIDRICTHSNADLSTGFLNTNGITCPLHLSIFDLNTGKPQNPQAEKSLNTYNVKIEHDILYIDI